MSVISLSEIQYIGDRSPCAKPTEDMVEEPTFPHPDCQQPRPVEKPSFANCDRKQTPLEVHFAKQGYDAEQIHSENDDNLKVVRTLMDADGLQGQKTLLDGMHAGGLQERKWDEELTNHHKQNANCSAADTYLAGGRLSNINLEEEDSLYKEDCSTICSTTELYSSSNPHCLGNATYSEQEDGTKLTDGLNSNGCISAQDSQREKTNDAGIDASCSMGSIETDTSCSDGNNKDQACIINELTSLASSKDFELDNIPIEGQGNDIFLSSDSNPLMEKMEGNVQNGDQEGELGAQEINYLEQDHALALWVKWGGKWQTGIRCSKADCPLSALRAKPTHERKRYILVFFPRTRSYSWIDMLLVRSISELPEPLLRGTHRRWRKLVKDLTIPHRYIMQKLAVAMLNISDQLHTEAVIENARKATVWKEFALEASQCRDYTDLGKMLLKLQTMILPRYVNHNWLENSFGSWKGKCQSAQRAESIETLTEELMDSVLWTEVNKLWNAPMQPELCLEWKTWKQEAMKLFFSLHPTATVGERDPNDGTNSLVMGYQTSSKRPKLEVHCAETCVSQMESTTCKILSQINMVDADSRRCNGKEILESTPPCQPFKVEELSMVAEASESHTLANTCNNGFVDESKDTKHIQIPKVGADTNIERGKGVLINAHGESNAKEKYRQCLAFVPSKGRQCGRWANDGDIYCCVHLNARYAEKLSQETHKLPVEAPMCEGTTTHGRKCKHRARHGSPFCKKHQLLRNHESLYSDSHSSGNALKENNNENQFLESFSSSDVVRDELAVKDIQTSHENLFPVVVGVTLDERNCLMKKSELYNALSALVSTSTDLPLCIGNYHQSNSDQCVEYAKRHTLYCEKHVPKFLKRARNGKSRLVSKDIFLNLLKNCNSRKEKLCLHQACELLYGFLKSGLSRQRPVSRGDTMAWILSEAMKDQELGECLLKLVSSEREKLSNIWGFNIDKDRQKASSRETEIALMPSIHDKDKYPERSVQCKLCADEFSDDHKLGIHWTEVHKKEARWIFRGYACAVCLTSFTNRKVLETHVKERHGVQFLQHSIIFRCMACNSHFVSSEQLWQHILSSHTADFRLPDLSLKSMDQSIQRNIEISNKLSCSNSFSENHDDSQKFTCRFCGLRFDLLPDLGRHHQVAHMNTNSVSQFPPNRGNYHLKRSRHCYPRLKKNFDASYRFKNRTSFGMQKHIKSSHSVQSVKELETQASESLGLGRLLDIHCSGVAETLFSKIQKAKPRPGSLEILSIARLSCCRTSFYAALEVKYGILQENVYLKALKLCSELNIQVGWHLEGFMCPKGCKPLAKPDSLAPLSALKHGLAETSACVMDPSTDAIWEIDESHYILDLEHLNFKSMRKVIILCEDVSFGKEPVPIACVVDEYLKNGQDLCIPLPWQAFSYVTKRLIGPSLCLEAKDLQFGCKCPDLKCNPDKCDHVYLFDDDHTNAKDVNGNSMHSRFAYDEKGRIVLEEGHLVYECNSMCKCESTCPNRVLQKGVQVKLEIFRTEMKGWAVRAGEAISRGTFICEYIGELLNDEEANRSGNRYGSDGYSYFYDIDAHINGARGLMEGAVPYVIDATKYGNVARFINHSCSPNLVNYLVLVEDMDCQLAHIGLYASRDIALGEELAYDYRSKIVPGEGHLCHCGAANCRGRLY